SPCSFSRRMTNCPGFCLCAMRGASITNRLMPGARNSACWILNMCPHGLLYLIAWPTEHCPECEAEVAVTCVTRECEEDHAASCGSANRWRIPVGCAAYQGHVPR